MSGDLPGREIPLPAPDPAPGGWLPQPLPRRFFLARRTDVSGVSGIGWVAAGVQFEDGTVVMRWLSEHRSTVVWADLEAAMRVHGHDGATTVEWIDNP